MNKILLKLYISGSSPRSLDAIANLRKLCAEDLAGQGELEVIDLMARPQIAADEKILATPTVIKELPYRIAALWVIFRIKTWSYPVWRCFPNGKGKCNHEQFPRCGP